MRLRWFGLFDCSDHRTCSIVARQSVRGVGLQDLSCAPAGAQAPTNCGSCGSRAAVVLEGPKGRRGTSARAAAVAARAGAHAASGQGTNPRRSLAMTYVMTRKKFPKQGQKTAMSRCAYELSLPPILPSLALITHLIKEHTDDHRTPFVACLALHTWQDMEYMDDYNDCHPIRNEASDFLLTQKHFSAAFCLRFIQSIQLHSAHECVSV